MSDPDDLLRRLLAGDRAALARAITRVESTRADHRAEARRLLDGALPRTGKAVRVGVTGVPGVGKSTLIDALGTLLTGRGHRVAVLAVDPSSSRSGGSILGDKTRMARLGLDPNAYVRPSPTAGTLGGVAAKTRETMLLCEAAGFDVVLVETVGVGQSETAVADLTDFFLVLMLPGAGDALQGIKKGVLELADAVVVNKADGEGGLARARAAAAEYRSALTILVPGDPAWSPPVMTVSGATGDGLEALWATVLDHRARLTATGALARKRRAQDGRWLWALVEERVRARRAGSSAARAAVAAIAAAVAAGERSPAAGADAIAALLGL
jgi:LAO/AO transport system kinase